VRASGGEQEPNHDFVEVEGEGEGDAVIVDGEDDADLVKQRDEFLASLEGLSRPEVRARPRKAATRAGPPCCVLWRASPGVRLPRTGRIFAWAMDTRGPQTRPVLLRHVTAYDGVWRLAWAWYSPGIGMALGRCARACCCA